MKKPSKLPFKINFIFILFLVFFIVSVFLSFKLKTQKENCAEYYAQHYEQEMQNLSYRLFLINETLQANYKLSGTKIPIDSNESFYKVFQENSTVSALYLKKYACSDCYIMTIKAILERISQWDAFSVISHSSNRDFINEMKDAGIIPANVSIVWTNKELPHGGGLHSTADLLILNPDMTIRFFLPLYFLNDSYFFEEYMLFLEKELTKKPLNK